MPINTTQWDSAEYLKTEEDVQLYLEACLEEAGDDPAFIAHALDVIAQGKNMSQFESIKQGLTEAIEHAAGQDSEAVVHLPRTLDVKSIREQVGMTQTAFAAVFDVSLSTLRRWERGERTPQGPARVLLHLVAHDLASRSLSREESEHVWQGSGQNSHSRRHY